MENTNIVLLGAKNDQAGSDADHLNGALCVCCDMIRQDVIVSVIDQWSKHVMMVIQAQNSDMKHRLE